LGTMPWKALPYADRNAKKELSTHFNVKGIPTFILLNRSLNVISAEGRDLIDSKFVLRFLTSVFKDFLQTMEPAHIRTPPKLLNPKSRKKRRLERSISRSCPRK